MRRIVFILFAVLVALIPAGIAAQDMDGDEGFLLRVDGDIIVPDGEYIKTVIVINGDILVEGIAGTVVAINSDGLVSGMVEDEIVVINGDLALADQSLVNDVTLINSDIERAPGAIVQGTIDEEDNWGFTVGWDFLSLLVFWLAFSVFVIAAALLFAAVGGRQLSSAALLLTNEIGPTILAALVVWIGLPILAVLLFLTIIGIPVGIGIFLFILPTLWFAGYLVAGARLGAAITRRTLSTIGPEHPYLSAVIGVVVLQAIGLLPVLGWLIVWLAGVLGGGALALLGWRAWRDRAPSEPAAAPPIAASPPPTVG